MDGVDDLEPYSAVVLAGGRATRLGGADKASVEIGGRTLLARALDAVVDAAEVVVAGEPVPTERPATFVVESPRHGGPVAALLTAVDSLLRTDPWLVVIAVDMPRLSHATLRRLREAAGAPGRGGSDGAVLVGPDGRRTLALVVRRQRLEEIRPDREAQHAMAVRTLLAPLDLSDVAARDGEHRDVDSWSDLRDLAEDRSED